MIIEYLAYAITFYYVTFLLYIMIAIKINNVQ